MKPCLLALTVAIACSMPARAATSNVDAYRNLTISSDLPTFDSLPRDQTLAAGANDSLTFTGGFDVTDGEMSYQLSQVRVTTADFARFVALASPPATPDASGPTTPGFSNPALLAQITLPAGAAPSSASGIAYNAGPVPLADRWALMLSGLGLAGWRARIRNPARTLGRI